MRRSSTNTDSYWRVNDIMLRGAVQKGILERIKGQAGEIDLELMATPVAVFAPHQDDEVLGCGGTIARLSKLGAAVKVVFMTDGSGSHSHLMAKDQLSAIRRQEATAAACELGVAPTDLSFLQFEDGQLWSHRAQAVDWVMQFLEAHRPATVFVPYAKEPPLDHVATHCIVTDALNTLGASVTIYEYPVWAWYHWPWVDLVQTDWRDTLSVLRNTAVSRAGIELMNTLNCTVDISAVLETKCRALQHHRSQMNRLTPESAWPILADVADGAWLDCFFRAYEYFRCSQVPGIG